MPNVISSLQATIVAQDVNNNIPITRGIGTPSFQGGTGAFTAYFNLNAGGDVVIPQNGTMQCVYIKNLAADGSAVKVVVKAKVMINGVLSALTTIAELQPGGVYIYWQKATGSGLDTLTLNTSGNTQVEFYLGS